MVPKSLDFERTFYWIIHFILFLLGAIAANGNAVSTYFLAIKQLTFMHFIFSNFTLTLNSFLC